MSINRFWQIFRLIFVVFSLYLLRDVFSRWDGFRFHSTFSEFIPSVGLVTIVWSMTALMVSLVIWLLIKCFQWFCQRMAWNINLELLTLFAGMFILLLVFAMVGKTLIIKGLLSFTSKFILFLCVLFVAMFLTWRYRGQVNIVHERITPLVWLFGIWLIVSMPIVVYNTWLKPTNNPLAQRMSEPSVTDKKRPNIILVSFDALTSRDMSVYGYNRPTTPFLNEWAKTAAIFNRFQSSSNWTPSAAASMMTGKRVWSHLMFQEDSKIFRGDTESLQLILEKNGYFNMSYSANPYASVQRLGIANSFNIAPDRIDLCKSHTFIGYACGTLDVIFFRLFADRIKLYTWSIGQDFILGKILREIFLYSTGLSKTETPPELVFNKFLEAVDNGIPEPFFAWIHLLPPHDPYLPGQPYAGMFSSSARLRIFNKQMMEEVADRKVKNKEDWGIYRARYDEFIRYCDKQFEIFIKEIGKRSKLKDAVVIFSSDHGESFEHDYFTHSASHLYEQVTHIPLIIKEPDNVTGVIINDLAEQTDLAPTILSLANIGTPAWMEGRSLLPLMRGEELPPKHVYSMNFQKTSSIGGEITKGTVAVWDGDYKLIYYLDENKSLLFNINEDPDEMNNLFDKEQDTGDRYLNALKKNLAQANERLHRYTSE